MISLFGSIRTRILVAFFIAALLPLIGVFFVYETMNRRSMHAAEFAKVREIGDEVARQISTIMERAANDLESIASNPILTSNGSTEEKLAEMRRLVRIYQFFTDLTLYDRKGFMLGSTQPDHAGGRDRSQWFKTAVTSGRKSVTSPYKSLGEPGLLVTVYLPLASREGTFQVITAGVRFAEVWQLLDGVRIGTEGRLVLLDQFGNVLASKDKHTILKRFDRDQPATHWRRHPQGYYSLNGERHLYSAHPLDASQTQVDSTWTLLCLEPLYEVDRIIEKNRAGQIAAALIGMLVVGLLGLFASRWLSSPLERVARTAAAVQSGDLEVRMPMTGPQEVARLAASFNSMLDDIRDHRDNLENKVASRTKSLREAQEELTEERASLAKRVELRTRELRAANKELARTARMKDEFLAGMSHELRTPLNAVLGLTESLEEGTYGELNDQQLDSLKMIDESGRHLLALINDILDVAKVDAGEMQLDVSVVEVSGLCESALNLVRQTATKKNLKLELNIDDQITKLACDERRLKQVLVNLLSNSVKFTTKGSVTLEVAADPADHVVRFVVRDTGIGIPDHQLERLFQPFVQLDSSLSRQYEGTGLGLALVYNLTEIHGGSVAVKSQTNKGTAITIRIPWYETVECDPPREASELPQSGAYKGTILVADDYSRELHRVVLTLQESGYEVHTAQDGAAVVAKTLEITPHAIISDAQMPGMDGIELCHHLKSDLKLKSIPLIALTGLDTPGDIRRLHEAGFSDCIPKPARKQSLLATLEFHLTKAKSRSALKEQAA